MSEPLQYDKLFDPREVDVDGSPGDAELPDESVYVFEEDVVLAVNVALAAVRPLLVYGPPGCGKSTLAVNIARVLQARFYSEVITSRTEARDLLWQFDAVRRLSDAQANQARGEEAYVRPGVLWKAFDPRPVAETATRLAPEHARTPEGGAAIQESVRAVVLLDEIDKADPDVPNGLLAPLGALQFSVGDYGTIQVVGTPPLIVITSNNERELSRPFLRRCVLLRLRPPSFEHLVKVAMARMGCDHEELYRRVAQIVVEMASRPAESGVAAPSTAEFLDAVRCCIQLRISPEGRQWELVSRAVLAKPLAT